MSGNWPGYRRLRKRLRKTWRLAQEIGLPIVVPAAVMLLAASVFFILLMLSMRMR
jgi:hypothetical protein